jgi:spore coat polysaccharide biosynthesis protein SpsF (cytidylyltransferase family)
MPTKYDYFSSVTPKQFSRIIELVNDFQQIMNAEFVNKKEIDYLKKSLLKPILKNSKIGGSTFSINEDFDYKRSNQNGLNIKEIEEYIESNYILSVDKKEGQTIQLEDLKKATIGVVIACRLKSSRLKSKALLKIGDLTSVEYCIRSAKKFSNVNHVILATSYLESDSDLENYTYDESVIFHKGHPENVIERYLDIVEKLKIDVIVRVTADNPFIDKDIFSILLESHFKSGSDYTTARETALGVNLEIFNKSALKKINSIFPNAEYSEYMTWYFVNNPDVFKLNFVDLPVRYKSDYRLTLDFDEDLLMYNNIHNELQKINPNFGILDIYNLLNKNPELITNSHISAKYHTDQELIKTLNLKTKINH